jgi:hypothetical protein
MRSSRGSSAGAEQPILDPEIEGSNPARPLLNPGKRHYQKSIRHLFVVNVLSVGRRFVVFPDDVWRKFLFDDLLQFLLSSTL